MIYEEMGRAGQTGNRAQTSCWAHPARRDTALAARRASALRMEHAALPLAMLAVLMIVGSFTGKWLVGENPYRSYTLQALAWLEGRLHLTGDYPWLELAVYEGRTYVSFPPFPSFVMLPFAAVFGQNTPDHLISFAFTCAGMLLALRLHDRLCGGRHGAFFVLYLYLGNGYLFIASQGWVWYLAQVMSFTLSLAALCAACEGKGGAALTLMACAFGCRPMTALYLPLVFRLLARHDGQASGRGAAASLMHMIKGKWRWAIVPLAIGGAYMALNFARFGNPFEFGHNYLPEFQRAADGQFSLSYAPKNFAQLFRLPRQGMSGGALDYDIYDTTAFWLIAPVWLTCAAAWAYALVRRRRACGAMLWALPAMLAAHLMIVCCHRTLGGYQFGNRYLVDMLPFAYCGLLLMMPRGERFAWANVPLFFMGFAVNLIGTVGTYNYWL